MSEWKEWTGKKLPKRYEHIVVMVRYRNGRESGPAAASWWPRWEWGSEPMDFDIVAYRRSDASE